MKPFYIYCLVNTGVFAAIILTSILCINFLIYDENGVVPKASKEIQDRTDLNAMRAERMVRDVWDDSFRAKYSSNLLDHTIDDMLIYKDNEIKLNIDAYENNLYRMFRNELEKQN